MGGVEPSRTHYGRAQFNMVDIPPTPKGGGLKRETVLRPPKLSLPQLHPTTKQLKPGQGKETLTHTRSTPHAFTHVQTHGPRQGTLTCAQSQSKPHSPQHEGQLWDLLPCAESSAFNLILGFLLWVPGDMCDLANQTGKSRV